MATTYQTLPFNSGIFFQREQTLAHQEAARAAAFGNGDIVQLVRPERGLKLVNARFGGAQLDSNGTPTLTATVRASNGSSTQNIITLTAAQLGAAGGFTQGLNVPSAIGWIVPARSWWFEVVFTAAPATGVAGAIYWAFDLTPFCYSDEDVTRPPAN
jgi:hypothetical protein